MTKILTSAKRGLALLLGVSLLYCAFPLAAQAGTGFPSEIMGFVFEDLDGNGVQDVMEPGIPGVGVELEELFNGSVVTSITTDANGLYGFFDLIPGSYNVMVTLGTLPMNFFPTTPTEYSVDLDPGLGFQADFGFQERQQNPPTIPEPSTMLLFGSGIAGLAAWRYRKSKTV